MKRPGRGRKPVPALRDHRRPALDDVSATIPAGRITGLGGPDGAGKTTFVRLRAGLLEPDAGRISVLGLDPIREPGRVHARIGYMPQKFGLYEDLTVAENLRLYAEVRGLADSEREAAFSRLLGFTGLGPFTTVWPVGCPEA
jgi:ABC-2 type transport system ATP-binding protein